MIKRHNVLTSIIKKYRLDYYVYHKSTAKLEKIRNEIVKHKKLYCGNINDNVITEFGVTQQVMLIDQHFPINFYMFTSLV